MTEHMTTTQLNCKMKIKQTAYSLEDLLMSDLWMWGMTPPPAMVPLISVSSSSSPLIASCKCLGVIRFTFRSLLAFPASSNTSAVRYSKIAAVYTAAVAPTRPFAATLDFSWRWTLPTGNCIIQHHTQQWENGKFLIKPQNIQNATYLFSIKITSHKNATKSSQSKTLICNKNSGENALWSVAKISK